jgi:4-amino-4-deoxy-L-arabinose transferase-like glycosyltransferase
LETTAQIAHTHPGPPGRPQKPRRAWPFVLVIVLLWMLIYLPGLFHPALLDDADSVHAEAAREMSLSGDWVTLHVDGIRYLEKAPLMYWCVAASFKLFGVHEWSARLPLALAVLALLLAVRSLAKRTLSRGAGFWSAVVLVTALGPYLFTRFLIPDLMVALWLTLTFDFFLRTLEEDPPSRASCWGLAVACALNVLTKGLIGLVFPAGAIFIFLLLTGNLKHLLRMRLVPSTIVFLIVAAPWHILAALRNPAQGSVKGFLWFYFVNEHFLRFLNKRVPRDYDTVNIWLFWGLMLVWLFPWSAFLPQALRSVPLRLRDLQAKLVTPDAARGRAGLLFLLWALIILLFFSFSTRQEYYVIPAIPALALLIGQWLANEGLLSRRGAAPKSARISAAVLLVVALGTCIAAAVLLWHSTAPAPGTELADLLTRNPQDYALSMGHFADLTPQALGMFRVPIAILVGALLIGSAACFFLRLKNNVRSASFVLAFMMIAVLWMVHRGLIAFEPILSSKDLAAAITNTYRPGDAIVIDGDYEEGSTLNFYTGIRVQVLNHREGNLWYGSYFPDAPQVFETDQSLLRKWRSPQRIYLWSQVRNPVLLAGLPVHELARSGGKFILINH